MTIQLRFFKKKLQCKQKDHIKSDRNSPATKKLENKIIKVDNNLNFSMKPTKSIYSFLTSKSIPLYLQSSLRQEPTHDNIYNFNIIRICKRANDIIDTCLHITKKSDF